MWTKSVGRKELAEILQSERLRSADGLRETERILSPLSGWDEVEVLWKDNPVDGKAAISAVLVEPNKERDLLAWVGTYVPSVRPLTAFCRVTNRQIAMGFLELSQTPRLEQMEEPCIGVILGETATYVAGKKELREIHHTACLSTLSFAIARAAALRVGAAAFMNDLPSKWTDSRLLCRAGQLPLTDSHIERPWGVVSRLAGPDFGFPMRASFDQIVLEACKQLWSRGEIDGGLWSALTADLGEFVHLQNRIAGPREDRVRLFESAITTLREKRSANSPTATFLCAYLANSISPGTLDHLNLLTPHLPAFPDLLLWYGLCAGLTSRTNLLNSLNGLARRLRRELLREDEFLNPPSCDIAYSELAIITSGARDWPGFRTSSSGQVIVELLPSINAHLRYGRIEDGPGEHLDELGSALKDVRNFIARANESLRRASRAAGLGDEEIHAGTRRPRKKF